MSADRDSIYANPATKPPLDETFYHLDDEELHFFKSQTGIDDDATLREHILNVQASAYKIHGYPCIRRFAFAKLRIARLPAYHHLLEIGRERKGAIFLDIGCCFGNDARKAVVDGYPIQNVIASDLRPEFWQFGHQLFKSTPESFPVPFVPGDVFSNEMIEPASVVYEPLTTQDPELSGLTSLTPLQGRISAIHASSFFHLFNEEKQLELAHRLASLLSPLPGSIIFGSHRGGKQKGIRHDPTKPARAAGVGMFCHSPESWRELWDGVVFKQGTVRVEAQLVAKVLPVNESVDPSAHFQWFILEWSVTRL